jgi:hypothetical protein
MHGPNVKSALEIILVDLLESLEDLWDLVAGEVVDRCEAYLATQHQEEWDLVDEENIHGQKTPPCGVSNAPLGP